MAVAAIMAMRHHEEEAQNKKDGSTAKIEGNADVYAEKVEKHTRRKSKGGGVIKSLCNKIGGLLGITSSAKVVPGGDDSFDTDDESDLEQEVPDNFYANPKNFMNVPIPFRWYINLAQYCYYLVNESTGFNNGVTVTIIIAGINVGVQTYPSMETSPVLNWLDLLILAIFTVELLVKIVMEGFRPWMFMCGEDWAWNFFDTTVVLLSYPVWGLEGGGSIALLRLVRLARLGKLIKKIPALQMIVQGLAGGLSSITYIMILLFLVFYLYGVVGFMLYATNDPFHFGTLPLSMLTLFRCATLENWGDIMFLNIFGCDVYPDLYVGREDETPENIILWCRNPGTSYALGPVYFVSFIVVAAMVMLSLFIGAVTISMSESMVELKEMQDKAKALAAVEHNMKRMEAIRKKKELQERQRARARKAALRLERQKAGIITEDGRDSPTLDHNGKIVPDEESDDEEEDEKAEVDVLKELQLKHPFFYYWYALKIKNLEQIEKEAFETREKIGLALRVAIGDAGVMDQAQEDEHKKQIEAMEYTGFAQVYHNFSKTIRIRIVDTDWFSNFMTSIILIASINVGIQTDWRVMRYKDAETFLDVVDLCILYLFTAEVVLKILALEFRPLKYFSDSWNVFDFLIVVGSFIPGAGDSVVMLRLLRLLRVLKLVKRLPQLAVIINALINGMVSIAYVGLVLVLFFYVFSIIGMLLFSDNDPWHFGSLHMAFFSLFQSATLDDWTILMYTSMYGCDKFPGVYEDFPEQCTTPRASGMVAVIYFLIFILVGAQVLLSLFIGVISTSMDEAQEDQEMEKELEKKIEKTRKKLSLNEERVEAMKYVFHTLDLDGGGAIDEEELKIGLDAIDAKMSEEEIIKILQSIAPDGSGVDINGFILFMYETPLFSRTNAISKITNAFAKKERGESASALRRNRFAVVQFFIDIFYYGGPKNRIFNEQTEAALLIQDKWLEIQSKLALKKETKSEFVDDREAVLERRRQIQSQLK